jgi:hypothetical protein
MVGNWVSGNGIDPDSGSPYDHNGIVIFSAADPVSVVVAANHISNEDVGIYIAGSSVTLNGLPSNKFSDISGKNIDRG